MDPGPATAARAIRRVLILPEVIHNPAAGLAGDYSADSWVARWDRGDMTACAGTRAGRWACLLRWAEPILLMRTFLPIPATPAAAAISVPPPTPADHPAGTSVDRRVVILGVEETLEAVVGTSVEVETPVDRAEEISKHAPKSGSKSLAATACGALSCICDRRSARQAGRLNLLDSASLKNHIFPFQQRSPTPPLMEIIPKVR